MSRKASGSNRSSVLSARAKRQLSQASDDSFPFSLARQYSTVSDYSFSPFDYIEDEEEDDLPHLFPRRYGAYRRYYV